MSVFGRMFGNKNNARIVTAKGRKFSDITEAGEVLLNDTDADSRLRAAYALSQTRNPEAIEPLAEASLSDADESIRKVCMEYIWSIGGNKAKETLRKLREDNNEQISKLAEKYLGSFDGRKKFSKLLFKAIYKKDYNKVGSLLKKGADPNYFYKEADDDAGRTPLIHAVQWHQNQIVDLLLKSGADVNVSNNAGITAFHLVCYYGDLELIKKFLKNGANINLEHPEGNPPLVFAIQSRLLKVIKFLLKKGADVHQTTKDRTTVIEWAKINASPDIMEVLTDFA